MIGLSETSEDKESKKALNKIFERALIGFDTSAIRQAIFDGKEYDTILEQYQDNFIEKEILKLQEVLSSEELKKWKDSRSNQPGSSLNLKKQIIDKLFNVKELKRDVTKLKQVLFQGGDHLQVLNKYSEQYPKKQIEIIKKILLSPELISLKEQEKISRGEINKFEKEFQEKFEKIFQLFKRNGINIPDVNLIKSICQGMPFLNCLDANQKITSAQYESIEKLQNEIKEILQKSKEEIKGNNKIDQSLQKQLDELLKDILDQITLKKVKNLLVLQQIHLKAVLQSLDIDLTTQKEKKLNDIIETQEFKSLEKRFSQKCTISSTKKTLRKVFPEKGIMLEIQSLINALANNQNIDQEMSKIKKNLKIKQFKQLSQALSDSEVMKTIGFSQTQIKKIKFIDQFQQKYKVNFFWDLKFSLAKGKDLSNILKTLQENTLANDFEKIIKFISSEQLVLGLRKEEIPGYQKKKHQLSEKFFKDLKQKEQLLESILLGLDINIVFDTLCLQQTELMKKINLELISQELRGYLKEAELPSLIFNPKIQIKINDKSIFINAQSKICEIVKIQGLNKKGYKFFTLNDQMLSEYDRIIQPIKYVRCQQFTISFIGQVSQIYLPYFSISKIKPILQKQLRTNLKLELYAIQSEQKIKLEDTDILSLSTTKNLLVYYYVNLTLTINHDATQKQIEVTSNQTIAEIKKRIQNEIGIKKQNQKWIIEGKEANKGDKTIQDYNIKDQFYGVHIQQIRTLEFYGFTQTNPIRRDSFKNFFIQNDSQFIQTLKKSQFPAEQYSLTFKNLILGYIFSAIKKHSLIQNSIKHVQTLVENSGFQELLWKPPSSKEKQYFNQTYVLYHILKCSGQRLIIDILRGLMNYRPIPLTFYWEDGRINYLFTQHYWIQNKAFNICSFGFRQIQGKSEFLNIIFEVNFQKRNNLHKQCQGGIQVQYNIYQSDQYYVNLLDVSNDIQENTKIQICQACNLLIIHFSQKQQDVLDWLKEKKIQSPRILIRRDFSTAFDKQLAAQRKKLKQANQKDKYLNIYSIVQLSEENINYYTTHINEVSNGIHSFIRKNFIQKSEKKQQIWKFSDFLALKANLSYLQFNKILKDIEKSNQNMTQITGYFNEYKIIQSKTDSLNEQESIIQMKKIQNLAKKVRLARPIQQIIHFCKNNPQLSTQAIRKLRAFLTIYRNQLFKDFNGLDAILKNAQKSEEGFNQAKNLLLQKIINMKDLKSYLTTKPFIQEVSKFISQVNSFKQPKDWQAIIKKIKSQFQFQMQGKVFSVENFWREAIYMNKFDPQYQFSIKSQHIRLYEQLIDIGKKQIQDSQSFQLINGDILQMATSFLSKIFESQEQKKIMVVAIFGPQSSGKSTLLNFVFGCDFMSSAGRCTKGVYGTYFQISNKQLPNCQAILVLDTQGLFSNYQNKKFLNRNSFDNKLVLFCLQVCDIIILNTKGDVTKESQQILELAFDSQLIDPNNLPEIYIVLNINGGQINPTQSRQIQKFCDTIIKTNEEAEKVMKFHHAVGMPMAFNEIPRKTTAEEIKKYLEPKKLPTQRFYKQTKKLCFDIIKIITYRGRKKPGRTLQQAFTKMDQTWSTINKYPVLTKHINKKLKKLQESIDFWKKQKFQKFLEFTQKIEADIQKVQISQLSDWVKIKEKQIQQSIKLCYSQYEQKFPKKDGELSLNFLIRQKSNDLTTLLQGIQITLKELNKQKRMKHEIDQADKKGFDNINSAIKKLQQKAVISKNSLAQQEKKNTFEKCWGQKSRQMMSKIERKKLSEQSYQLVLEIYNNWLQEKNNRKKIVIQRTPQILSMYQVLQPQFQKTLRAQFEKSFESTFIFESSNDPPVMNIQKKIGDLSFKYLDMSKYFERKKSPIFLSVYYYNLKQAINRQYIKKSISDQLAKEVAYQQIADLLKSDFQKIGVIFEKQNLKQCIKQKFQSSFIAKWLNYVKQLYRSDLKKIQWSVEKKRYYAYPWLYSIIYQDEIDKMNFEFKIIPNIKQLKELIKQIPLEKYLNTLSQYETIAKLMVKIANMIIQGYVDKSKQNGKLINYRQIKQISIRNQLQKDLAKINILPKWNGNIISQNEPYFVEFQVIQKQFLFNDFQEVKTLLQTFSRFWKHKDLNTIISKNKNPAYYSINFGKYEQVQISIKSCYSRHKILQKYINKQYGQFLTEIKKSTFTKFVSDELNYKISLDEIYQECLNKKIGQKETKKGVEIMISKVNSVVEEINKDLRQVSQKVRYDFVAELHFYACHLFWKFKQRNEWEKKLQILKKFQNKKAEQQKRFFDMVSGNPSLENSAAADKIMEMYKKHLNEIIIQDKKQYLALERKEYKQKYNRQKVQALIDKKLHQTNDKKEIFTYLKNPVRYTEEFYKNIQNQAAQTISQIYKYTKHIGHIIDFQKSINSFMDNCQNEQKCISELIFEGEISENKNQYFIPLLVEVLLRQNSNSVDHNNIIGLKIKQGQRFSASQSFQHKQNISFIKNLKKCGVIITNLKLFLFYLSQSIKDLKQTSLGLNIKLTSSELLTFKNSIEVRICKSMCPCCRRNCDVDLEYDVHHKVHRCKSGHQMRAIGGMRIQQIQKGVKRYKPSVQRCEDLTQDYEFEFNSKMYTWSQFKIQKKNQWDFNFDKNNLKTNEARFSSYWQKAGPLICQYFSEQTKIPLTWVPYTIQQLESQSKVNTLRVLRPTNYIFALDQSYSMQGDSWLQLIQAMKKNLSFISNLNKTENQFVSIFKFNGNVEKICEYQNPCSFDTNTILFKGGGTRFGPAFQMALSIMQKRNEVDNIFMLISDGLGQFPQKQIFQIKQFKKRQIIKNMRVEYISFLIGPGGDVMQKIKEQLQGKHNCITSISQFENIFKEVMKSKAQES